MSGLSVDGLSVCVDDGVYTILCVALSTVIASLLCCRSTVFNSCSTNDELNLLVSSLTIRILPIEIFLSSNKSLLSTT